MFLTSLNQQNFQENTFPVTGKRETVKLKKKSDWKNQVYNAPSVRCLETYEKKTKTRSIGQEDLRRYADRKALIQENQQGIRDHVDARIQLFFQQAILCYNTPFEFRAQGAEDQIGVGTTLKNKGAIVHKTQAAHSSTFPCLYAYPKDAEGRIDDSKKFVFLKYSHSYNAHNSTIELPIEVNQFDTKLDGKTNERMLRSQALHLINEVARAHIDPKEATRKFLDCFLDALQKIKEKKDQKDVQIEILKIYSKKVQNAKENLAKDSTIFDQIMGVNPLKTDEKLREIVYRRRYKLNQDSQLIESKVARNIFETQKHIFNSKNNSLKTIDYKLRFALLEKSKEAGLKLFLEKFLCTSLSQLKSGNKKNLIAKPITIENFKNKHKEAINQLINNLKILKNELEELELYYRSHLFKDLRRCYKNWTQEKFKEEFKEKHPSYNMSKSMVSRFEDRAEKPRKEHYKTPLNQRRKNLTIEYAQRIASTFAIDTGLFLGGWVTID